MSDILVTGNIVMALQPQSGVSQKTGNQWVRQSYIIEHEHGQYPRRLVFDVSNAKIQELNLQVGEMVTIHLNADCREYPQGSGKYFNSLEAWKADRMQQTQYAPQPTGYAPYPPQPQTGAAPFPPQPTTSVPQQPASAPFPPQQQVAQAPVQQPTQQVAQPQQGGLPFPPAQ